MRIFKSMFLLTGSILVCISSGPAKALEPGKAPQTKPGITFGIPAAAFPTGLYFAVSASHYNFQLTGPGTAGFNTTRGSAEEASAYLLWVPGWSFLGATYSALISTPFGALSVGANPLAGYPGASFAGAHNAFIAPLRLHWSLGNGFFLQTGIGVYVPSGTIEGPLGNSNVGSAYYTIQPDFVVSYLAGGWNLTAYSYLEINTKNSRSGYTTGNMLHVDLTATRQLGKWTLGPVAYYVEQVTADTSSATFDSALSALVAVPGGIQGFNAGKFATFAVGAFASYDFGFMNLAIYATNDVYARAYGGNSGTTLIDRVPFTNETTTKGWNIFGRLIYPLWVAQPPAPPSGSMMRKSR